MARISLRRSGRQRPLLKLLPALGVAACFAGLAAAPVAAAATNPPGGADLSGSGGCKVSATATDKDGNLIGAVTAPGGGGPSQDRPFVVSSDGNVHYEASSAAVLKHHSWHVDVFGVPVMRGGDPNDKNEQSASGDVNPGKVLAGLPFKVTGLFFVSGGITADGGLECSGNGWAKLDGQPAGSGLFDVGLLLALIGLAGVLWALPERKGVVL